jgi:hypothetical protein
MQERIVDDLSSDLLLSTKMPIFVPDLTYSYDGRYEKDGDAEHDGQDTATSSAELLSLFNLKFACDFNQPYLVSPIVDFIVPRKEAKQCMLLQAFHTRQPPDRSAGTTSRSVLVHERYGIAPLYILLPQPPP